VQTEKDTKFFFKEKIINRRWKSKLQGSSQKSMGFIDSVCLPWQFQSKHKELPSSCSFQILLHGKSYSVVLHNLSANHPRAIQYLPFLCNFPFLPFYLASFQKYASPVSSLFFETNFSSLCLLVLTRL
jgi:hypothetical protein